MTQVRGFKPSAKYQRLYNRYNKLYFSGELPPCIVGAAPLLKIEYVENKVFGKSKKVSGGEYALLCWEDDQSYIILDKGTTVFHIVIAKQSVLHEQIHLYLGTRGHGKEFKDQIRRIAALGALDTLI
jgi:hypothetical protein